MIKDVFQGAVFLIARNKLFSLVFVLLLSLFGFQRNEYEYFSVATQSIDPIIFYNYFDASFFVGCCIVLAALQYAWLRKVAPRHVSNSVAGFLACGAVSVIAVAILLLCRNFSGLTILSFVEWATFSTGHPDYFNSILLPYYDLGSIQFMGFVFPVIFLGLVLFLVSPILLRLAFVMPAFVWSAEQQSGSFWRQGAGFGWPMTLAICVLAMPYWLVFGLFPGLYYVEVFQFIDKSEYGFPVLVAFLIAKSSLLAGLVLFTVAVVSAAYKISALRTPDAAETSRVSG